jgi:formylglycine-generating enzyme required for sulfatase activity
VATPAAHAAPVAEESPAALDSAAEEEERRVAEEHAARREATEAFVADLEIVDGMKLVPAGTFLYSPEPREIFLDSFYVDRLPVTNAEYQRFVLETGYRSPRFQNNPRFDKPNQPVVGVSLGDARQFARWAGKELPSEQQWEKAARGTDGRPYPWGNDPPGTSDASFGQDPSEGGPAVVGQSLRNVSPFGACDMAGSMWEWTSSRFEQDSDFQCVRGGSYNDPAEMLEVSYRLEAHPKDKSEAIGFRCVRNIHH